jgi:hypothetical protein
MRILGLTIAVALCTTLGVSGAGAVQAKTPPARLEVTKLAPLAVRGSFFRARERVRLTVSYSEVRRSRVVRASRVGSFAVTFQTLYLERCGGAVIVSAVGARGSRARTQLTPPSVCPPPPP